MVAPLRSSVFGCVMGHSAQNTPEYEGNRRIYLPVECVGPIQKPPKFGRNSGMGMDRRMFERIEVAVEGELLWQVKRGGIVKTNRVDVTTLDLSVDGARVTTNKRTRLPIGASVRVTFNGQQSAARIRATLPDPKDSKRRLLLIQFEEPNRDFLQVIDQWVDAGKGGNRFKSEYWRNREVEQAS